MTGAVLGAGWRAGSLAAVGRTALMAGALRVSVTVTATSQIRSATIGRNTTEASSTIATAWLKRVSRAPKIPAARACTLRHAMLRAAASIPATPTIAKPASLPSRRMSAPGMGVEPISALPDVVAIRMPPVAMQAAATPAATIGRGLTA